MRSTATGGKRWQEARSRCSQRSETFRGVTRERRTDEYPMEPRLLKQMHEQMVREAQRKALPRELRAARKRCTGWASALARISIRQFRLRAWPKR
jgi:hypothetical protein